MKLIFSEGSGSITNDSGTWSISVKPAFSFSYDGIFYNDDVGAAVKFMGTGRSHLSEAEGVEVVLWLAAQLKPEPVPPTLAEVIASTESALLLAVQNHLDEGAKVSGYDSIVSACSYAGAPNPFQAEGQSFVSWRGYVWAYCYGELGKVLSGQRSIPTVAELLAELPVRTP